VSRSSEAARRRDRKRDLAALRDAIELNSLVHSTDGRIRRLVRQGWAQNPDYSYGAARDATAEITEAGRAEVEKG